MLGQNIKIQKMMTKILCILIITSIVSIDEGLLYTQRVSAEVTNNYVNDAIYVDPINGDDNNGGTLTNPFKTIERARSKVRTMNSNMTKDIEVFLRGGTYIPTDITVTNIPLYDVYNNNQQVDSYQYKTSSLTFEPEDSGTNGYDVVYKAYNSEVPIISGEKKITGWILHDTNKNIYKAPVEQGLNTRQLYVNGNRAIRARSSESYLTTLSYDKNSYTSQGASLVVEPAEIANWNNQSDIEFVFKSLWTMPRCGVDYITSNDSVSASVYLKQPGWQYISNKGGSSAGAPWYVENAYELLDEEGEWYLDRNASYIYYKPKSGENITTANVIVPQIDQLLTLKGESLDSLVHNIRFEGITFNYSGWLRPSGKNGHSDAQNNNIREQDISININRDVSPQGAAVMLTKAKSITFERCNFSKLGITGIKITDASQDNLIRGCTFSDISGGAIYVGEPGWRQPEDVVNYNPSDSRQLIKNNDIISNYIYDVAVEYKSAAAISATYVVDMDVSHNEIINVPYSAMHMGYGWAELETTCTKNFKIQNNYIEKYMRELVDGGGIYLIGGTGGTEAEPNIISGNFFKDQGSQQFGSLYFDNGSNRWTATNNAFDSVKTWLLVNWNDKKINVNNSYINSGYSRILATDPVTQEINVEEAKKGDNQSSIQAVRDIASNAGLLPEYRDIKLRWTFEDFTKAYIRDTLHDFEAFLDSGRSLTFFGWIGSSVDSNAETGSYKFIQEIKDDPQASDNKMLYLYSENKEITNASVENYAQMQRYDLTGKVVHEFDVIIEQISPNRNVSYTVKDGIISPILFYGNGTVGFMRLHPNNAYIVPNFTWQADTRYSVKILIDTVSNKASLYINGSKLMSDFDARSILSGQDITNADARYCVSVSPNDRTLNKNITSAYFDNFKIYRQFEPTVMIGGISETGYVTLSFSNTMDVSTLTDANISLSGGGGNIYGITTDSSLTKCTVKINNYSPNEQYTLSLSNIKDISGNGLYNANDIFYENVRLLQIGVPKIKDMVGNSILNFMPNQRVYVSAYIKNNSTTAINTVLIAAIYDLQGNLINVSKSPDIIVYKSDDLVEINTDIQMPDIVSDKYLKVFIWDGLYGMQPLYPARYFEN